MLMINLLYNYYMHAFVVSNRIQYYKEVMCPLIKKNMNIYVRLMQ